MKDGVIAAACRALALELPILGKDRTINDDGTPCCVWGHILARAKLQPGSVPHIASLTAFRVLVNANDRGDPVIEHLRALAEVLDHE